MNDNQETLIISDIHEDLDYFHKAMDKYAGKYDRLVFLGDFGDSFATPHNPARVVQLYSEVKPLLIDPNVDVLLGNHDAHYRWGGPFRCSGYSQAKHAAINQVLSREDWAHFKLYVQVGKWLLSHAGIHPKMFYPTNGSKAILMRLESMAKEAIDLADQSGACHTLLGAGWSRGGGQPVGGIDWLDWNDEFEPIPGINQIVGHTHETRKVRNKTVKRSENWCIDTGGHHVGWLHGDKFEVEEV